MSKFIIKEKSFGNKSASLREIVTNDLMKYISLKITGKAVSYSVEYLPERNVGNYIVFEHNLIKHYIILLNYRSVGSGQKKSEGRNSFTQSIPTAYRQYLQDTYMNKKIYFLDVNFDKKNQYEKSVLFALKLAMSIGIQPMNDVDILPYISVDEIIRFRNKNRENSRQNNPTFLEIKNNVLILYGKSFGANAKETELLCFALREISDKKIIFYQIRDNKSEKLSKEFLDIISTDGRFEIIDKTYSFEDLVNPAINSSKDGDDDANLRNPRFVYNLFELHGEKKCALCTCKVSSIIDGAHIFPIEAIKGMDLSENEKFDLATNPQNGIWLCKNHHKLFDNHIIKIEKNGNYLLRSDIEEEDTEFIVDSIDSISLAQINQIDSNLLQKRYSYYNLK